MVDVNRAVDSVARLGPGHFIAVLALFMVMLAGYVIHESLGEVETELIELRHELERNTEHADQRGEAFIETQEAMLRLLVATCRAAANGNVADRRACDEAAR